MMGLLLWKESGVHSRHTVTLTEDSVFHMRLLRAEILRGTHTPEPVLRHRVRRAAKRLRKLGIQQVILPSEFAFSEQLADCGIQPVSTLTLRRALAADWTQWLLEKRGIVPIRAQVAVVAQQLTGEVVRTVTELCLRHRYVLLDAPYGGEELCRQLRREYGFSLQLKPSKDKLEEAAALVLFDEPTGLTCSNPVVLHLYHEEEPLPPLALPPELEEAMPEGIDRVLLAAALQRAGLLRMGQIGFRGL